MLGVYHGTNDASIRAQICHHFGKPSPGARQVNGSGWQGRDE